MRPATPAPGTAATPTAATTTRARSNGSQTRTGMGTVAMAGDDDADDESLLLAAPDPLAAEPLSAEEIQALERGPLASTVDAMDEQREGALGALRKVSEVKLPIDPDAAASVAEATDARLFIRTRTRSRPKRR